MARYKTQLTVKCPFCDAKSDREHMVYHIEDNHSELIPKDHTAARVLFNHLHKVISGRCIICSKPTEWDEKLWKYKRICINTKCSSELRHRYIQNMERVGKSTKLSEDPDRLKLMMKNRKISGSYTFKDGGVKDYMGTYEAKALEFIDQVLNIHSSEIVTPGPMINYPYNNQILYYFPDLYYISANLLIEIKDGGDNPNNRSMESYREKQLAKEKAILKDKQYNYIRLTNNNFTKLFEILATIKYNMLHSVREPVIRVHEEVNGFPPTNPKTHASYIVPYGFKNVFSDSDIEGYGFTNCIFSKNLLVPVDGQLKMVNKESFLSNRSFGIYRYTKDDNKRDIVLSTYLSGNKIDSTNYILEVFTNSTNPKSLLTNLVSDKDIFKTVRINEAIERSIQHEIELLSKRNVYLELIGPSREKANQLLGDKRDRLQILEDINGFFVINPETNIRTESTALYNINNADIDIVYELSNTTTIVE